MPAPLHFTTRIYNEFSARIRRKMIVFRHLVSKRKPAKWLMTVACLLSGQLFAQNPATEFYHEKPSKYINLPEGTWKTIDQQNKILLEQGRSVNVHSQMRSNTSNSTSSVCGTCQDMGAENGWSTWQAYPGENYDSLGMLFSPVAVPTPPRFNITSGTGKDPLTPGVRVGDPPITVVAPPGFGSKSIQLGERATDGVGGGCGNNHPPFPAGCAERLTYCFTVGPADTNFVYAYAFIMENPNDTSHTLVTMPFVEFMILDASGDTLPCAYQHYIASISFPGQYTCNKPRYNGGGPPRDTALYKPWTIQGVNLSSYIGQTLTVVITNADCRLGGHFAHSYWDFACSATSAVLKPNCYTNVADSLRAPASPDLVNTYSYTWYKNHNPVPVGNTQLITPFATPGDTFTVKVTMTSGCNFYIRYVPQHYVVTADFTSTGHCDFANFNSTSFSPSSDDPISNWSWIVPCKSLFPILARRGQFRPGILHPPSRSC